MKKDQCKKVIRVAPLVLSMGLVTITSSYSGNHAQKLFNKETIDKSNEIDSSVKSLFEFYFLSTLPHTI